MGAVGEAATPPVVRPDAGLAVRELAARVVAPPGRVLVISDFDGTLAEIVADPLGARIEPIALRALRRLARFAEARPERLGLAMLSGRAMPDLAARVRVGGIRYLGNHGFESGWLPRRGSVAALVARGRSQEADAVATDLGLAVSAAVGDPDWLFVEHKGASIAFHYRRAPDPDLAGRQIGAAVDSWLSAHRSRLERLDGRRIIEARPVGAGGKGAAVRRLLTELQPASVLSLGDDRSDAEGFAVLSEERAARRLAALNVGVHDRQATPPELIEAADVVLDTPRDAGRLLEALAAALDEGRAGRLPT